MSPTRLAGTADPASTEVLFLECHNGLLGEASVMPRHPLPFIATLCTVDELLSRWGRPIAQVRWAGDDVDWWVQLAARVKRRA